MAATPRDNDHRPESNHREPEPGRAQKPYAERCSIPLCRPSTRGVFDVLEQLAGDLYHGVVVVLRRPLLGVDQRRPVDFLEVAVGKPERLLVSSEASCRWPGATCRSPRSRPGRYWRSPRPSMELRPTSSSPCRPCCRRSACGPGHAFVVHLVLGHACLYPCRVASNKI